MGGVSVFRKWCSTCIVALLLSSCWASLSQAQAITQSPAQGACPPSTATVAPPPSHVELVACVGLRPITTATFKHWMEVLRSGVHGGNGELPSREHEATAVVMDFLIAADWVFGEAGDLHVRVSSARVHRYFDHLRHEQFPRAREFRKFLRQTKETVADLLMRTELQLLAQRIQQRVAAHHHGARAKQRALTRFTTNFRRKWRAQTYCASQYAVSDCGHVQASV